MTSHDGNLEARLRGALSARAQSVTAADLQPAVPPTVASAQRSRRLPWRWPRLLTGAALASVVGGAAVAAAAWLPGEERPAPAPNPPAATVPSQSVSPAPPSPSLPPVPASPDSSESLVPTSPEPEATAGRDAVPKGNPVNPGRSPAAPTRTPPSPVPTSPDAVPSPPPAFG